MRPERLKAITDVSTALGTARASHIQPGTLFSAVGAVGVILNAEALEELLERVLTELAREEG